MAVVNDRRSNPERICTVCLQGHYVVRIAAETTAEPGKEELRMPWHIEACNCCGHVQIFRRDWTESS